MHNVSLKSYLPKQIRVTEAIPYCQQYNYNFESDNLK